MSDMNYLQWLSRTTPTTWWHDSGDPKELPQALENGAVGVTTNPVLVAQALQNNKEYWRGDVQKIIDAETNPRTRAESLMRIVVTDAARHLEPIYRATSGKQGYVCAQVDPSLAGNRQAMQEMAKRFSAWAPNIAVKLPATSAGLDVMERCCSEGITVTITVSFSVAQAFAAGKRYQGVVRSNKAGGRLGKCFTVIMIGRLDDYLREVFADGQEDVSEEEIQMAGLGVVKHAYSLYRQHGFDATLLIAALRGTYHMTGLAGGHLTMSIHPVYQKRILEGALVRAQNMDTPIPRTVQEKLERMPEFMKAYDPQGLSEKEMLTFGLTQRTLAQFMESGWRLLEQFRLRSADASG